MKVSYTSHGGQAAGLFVQRPPVVVDAATLDPTRVSELKSLVDAAIAAPPPAARSDRTRDEMSYTITVQDDGHETRLSQSDTTMSAEFRRLLDWLRHHPGS
ncbi:protealysin inhibitor emfourin [Bradyrhizobium sp. HKCCYLS1011]|uniref:protealysin inhibitor emfourin n=1 Tax=Bradyrhizobium sp. HKCCYLS1011 TaxID=3420733 RepID=UPI003EB84D51